MDRSWREKWCDRHAGPLLRCWPSGLKTQPKASPLYETFESTVISEMCFNIFRLIAYFLDFQIFDSSRFVFSNICVATHLHCCDQRNQIHLGFGKISFYHVLIYSFFNLLHWIGCLGLLRHFPVVSLVKPWYVLCYASLNYTVCGRNWDCTR